MKVDLVDLNICTIERKLFFDKLIMQAEEYYNKGLMERSLSILTIASTYGYLRHFGEYYSQELEDILRDIGKATMPTVLKRQQYSEPKKILHVASEFYSVGGHTRLFLNWVQYDLDRSHSLILTNQRKVDLPDNVIKITTEYCEKVICLKDKDTKFIERAKKLRVIAREYDLIVLHIHPQDVIPSIAFYELGIPIIMVNHSDHTFWIGRNILSFIAEIREYGKKITNKERNISEKYQYILPIPLEKPVFNDRQEVRKSLGFDNKDIVIFSVASSHKYKEINGRSIDCIITPLLEKYENLKVVVVGPSNKEEFWKNLNEKSNNRVKAVGIIKDVTNYYIGSDLYIDSYPTSSLTSLLDAGKYGLPFFSLSNGEMQLDDPALLNIDFLLENSEKLTNEISKMIDNPKLRKEYALECQQKINFYHIEKGWLTHLEKLYCSLEISLQGDDTKLSHNYDNSGRKPDELLMYMYPQYKTYEVEYVYFFSNRISLLFHIERMKAIKIIFKSFMSDPKTTLKAIVPVKLKRYLKKLLRRLK